MWPKIYVLASLIFQVHESTDYKIYNDWCIIIFLYQIKKRDEFINLREKVTKSVYLKW